MPSKLKKSRTQSNQSIFYFKKLVRMNCVNFIELLDLTPLKSFWQQFVELEVDLEKEECQIWKGVLLLFCEIGTTVKSNMRLSLQIKRWIMSN